MIFLPRTSQTEVTAPTRSYIDKCHDPESILHNGLLVPSRGGHPTLTDVVLCNGTVSQHVPEMMMDLSPVGCVVPAARL